MGSPKKPTAAPSSATAPPSNSDRDDGAPFSSSAVLVIDNGGFHVKAMLMRPGQPTRAVRVPNCVGAAAYVGRGIVGEPLYTLPHYHGFMVRRPTDRGYVVDGLLQALIWECVLQQLGVEDERSVELVLTVPFAAPKPVATLLHALLTRRFHFRAITVVSSHFLALLAHTLSRVEAHGDAEDESDDKRAEPGRKRAREEEATPTMPEPAPSADALEAVSLAGTGVVVDVGFSSTTVVPYVDGLPVYSSIVRMSVGGKLLTNRLKEHLSFTQVNVLEDGWLINHVRESCCYVAAGTLRERLASCAASSPSSAKASAAAPVSSPVPALLYYLPTIPALLPLGCTEAELPSRVRLRPSSAAASTGPDDGTDSTRGATLVEPSSLQHLRLQQEAFLIPELLFCPGDVGLDEMGLVQSISHGIFERGLLAQLPLLRQALLANVWVFGGVANTTGFLGRLYTELQAVRHPQPSSRVEETAELVVPAALQHLLTGAESAKAARKAPSAPALTARELAPLIGAFHLFAASSSSGRHEAVSMRRVTAQKLLHARARVALSEATKRSCEEDLFTAMSRLL